MLNIRINLTIDMRKVMACLTGLILIATQLVTPAHALPPVQRKAVIHEKVVTVALTHLKVTTTKSEAREALASPQSKYFDTEALTFLTVYTKGWSLAEWKCLRYIWNNESHFNPLALNKRSGAYGVAQFMPSTWGNYNVAKTSSSKLQIKYGLRYIQVRYGTACNAKAFWERHYWY